MHSMPSESDLRPRNGVHGAGHCKPDTWVVGLNSVTYIIELN